MYVPLFIKTDYSLLKSLIKVKDLVNISPVLGIIDDNLSYVMEFYNMCKSNNIKPIIGLDIIVNDKHIYLFAKNYDGYLNLIRINNIRNERDIALIDLELYNSSVLVVVPYNSIELYDELNNIYELVYLNYTNETEKQNSLLQSKNIIFGNIIRCLKLEDVNYLKYLEAIDKGVTIDELAVNNCNNYLLENISEDDIKTTEDFSNLINIELDFSKRHIPHLPDGERILIALVKKGLNKRLNYKIDNNYLTRVKYEFSIIKEMGFIDYFLIVYDYVLYAKKNGILVGPGRGSAAGSLISYALGITDIDPIKFNLMFERFLNKERITMPDIDLDFEVDRREEVRDYIRNKYGDTSCALIMAYGTLGSRQVIRDVAKVLNIEEKDVSELSKLIDPRLSLKDNLNIEKVKNYLIKNKHLKSLYQTCFKFEGLKKHITTHAAGMVISDINLNELIPLTISGGITLTGYTMDYLEQLGLIKMDILALENLDVINNIIKLIKNNLKEDIILSDIKLDDEKTLKLFYDVNTVGIFQFESEGMKNFLRKLKVSSFSDLIAAVALFRPGPMDNIDSFIRRKEGKDPIDYFDSSLETVLKETYGIIVYQEQVIEILNIMGGYSYSEADIVRRAMSKKKKEVLEKEKKHFVTNAIKKGYKETLAIKVFDYILKFANYGFNKAHSVCYALVGYWMAYLKSNYRISFFANLLNMSIGSEIKTKEYINECKANDIKVIKPDINISDSMYKMDNLDIIIPLTIIKNVGNTATSKILEERSKGLFKDYFDFVARCYGQSVNRKVIESLINASVFDSFGMNHHTLIENLDSAITYGELMHDLDESLVEKPIIDKYEEYDQNTLMHNEIDLFGFYITNHPASKFSDVIKSNKLYLYFDKFVKTVVLIDKITTIKTKKGDDMAFIDGSDEYGIISYTIFPKNISQISGLNKGTLIEVDGQVNKRFDKYQIVVKNIIKK